jgi:excisionase family DNA binding protein
MNDANVIKPQDATPMTRAEFEAYIDKRELARRIGKTVRTVDTWMAEGWIPFYKVGRTVCFRWSEVDQHIRAHFRVGLRVK